MSKTKKRVFLSDIHIGDGFDNHHWFNKEKCQLLDGFLDFLNGPYSDDLEGVILLGDVLENWVCPAAKKPPSFIDIVQNQSGIFNKFLSLSDKIAGRNGNRIVYVPGNHDMGVEKDEDVEAYFNKKIVFAKTFEADGIWAEHGHRHGFFNNTDNDFSSHINGYPPGYFISRISATNSSKTRELRAFVKAVFEGKEEAFDDFVKGAKLKLTSHIAMPTGPAYQIKAFKEELLAKIEEARFNKFLKAIGPELNDCRAKVEQISLENNDLRVIIFGHTHEAGLMHVKDFFDGHTRVLDDDIYANIGCWVNDDPATFIETSEEYNAVQVRLLRWDGKKPTQMDCKTYNLPYRDA